MIVRTGNDRVVKFRECGDILYYFDTSGHDNPTNNKVPNCYFLSTVADNKISGANYGDIIPILMVSIAQKQPQHIKNKIRFPMPTPIL